MKKSLCKASKRRLGQFSFIYLFPVSFKLILQHSKKQISYRQTFCANDSVGKELYRVFYHVSNNLVSFFPALFGRQNFVYYDSWLEGIYIIIFCKAFTDISYKASISVISRLRVKTVRHCIVTS